MEEITIRPASPDDLNVLLTFEHGVITTERPFDPTLKDGAIHYYDIAQMIKAQHIEVVVAEINSEIIGSGYARIEESKDYLKHQKHAYLGFMYVKPGYRGKGVNQKVIQALQEWSLTQGITEFRLEVYHANESAIKAYEKVGFSRHMIEMRMQLPAAEL